MIKDRDLLARYERLKGMVTDRKEEWDRLISFIEAETAWLTSPASTRFHLSEESGLLRHSCNVAENLLRIKEVLAPEISDESCVIVGLLHDLGKAGMPGNPQYIPNEPTPRQKQFGYGPTYPYSFNDKLTYLSVPIRSLYLIMQYLPLSEDEAQAIVYHDGQYVEDNRSAATKERPLTLLISYADSWSSFVTEK